MIVAAGPSAWLLLFQLNALLVRTVRILFSLPGYAARFASHAVAMEVPDFDIHEVVVLAVCGLSVVSWLLLEWLRNRK